MPNKMLIDATHPEETRVVVLRGHRVEEFDFESANRKQLRGNIYLAKVTRVEPSLQAAFVDYGGNRHGFLAFSEIHPDYYQIPVADRQALIAEDERAQRAADAEADHRAGRRHGHRERASQRARHEIKGEPLDNEPETERETDIETGAMAAGSEHMTPTAHAIEDHASEEHVIEEPAGGAPAPDAAISAADEVEPLPSEHTQDAPPTAVADETTIAFDHPEATEPTEPAATAHDEPPTDEHHAEAGADTQAPERTPHAGDGEAADDGNNITEVNGHGAEGEEEVVESVGGADAMEEVPERTPRLRRQYKIQEVIKRRQVMLVQVVKEERGTKGAALTTYLSLAGRYSVLMPNTARGGGISRKITSADDRRRLKEIAQELEVPEGMGVILRTAGAARTKTEVKRDFEYLLRLWETVRDLTLKSTAPTLVYEEGSLVKRSIRDLYNKDIEEILVAGDDAYKEAKEFMRMLMPSHAKNVKPYHDALPVFTRHGIESQLDAMFSPVMQLRSGGYIVINQAEALVAIDVNSGRATREHHIEDTALKTNLEAAEEIARQLRLRDLAGLIVIDFIDMDEKRNNRAVERRLKECLRHDRARIQVGHISHFGLLEMSRQRIRSSVLESSTEKCPHCGGTGHVRSVSSVALQVLRSLEEMLLKGAMHNLNVRTRSEIALYLLNHKRAHLRALEERFRIAVVIEADASIAGQLSFVIEKGEQVHSPEQAKALAQQPVAAPAPVEEEEDDEEIFEDEGEEARDAEDGAVAAPDEEAEAEAAGEQSSEREADQEPGSEQGRGRRRRRRRGRRGGEGREGGAYAKDPEKDHETDSEAVALAPDHAADFAAGAAEPDEADEAHDAVNGAAGETAGEANGDGERRRRRRGRRGGRRNRRGREGEAPLTSDNGEAFEPEHAQPEHAQPKHAYADADFDGETEPSPVVHVPITTGEIAHQSDAAAQDDPHKEPAPPDTAPASRSAASIVTESVPAESPRRRSTVREPAPTKLHEATSPAATFEAATEPPEPVVSSPAESEDRPRRSGWWSKRALGKG
jgi:ribonuclease E